MKKFTKIEIILMVVYLSMFFIACLMTTTPTPKMDENNFSSKEVVSYIDVISREPHSVFDSIEAQKKGQVDPLETVRNYIVEKTSEWVDEANTLNSNQCSVEVKTKSDFYDEEFKITHDINNVLVTIPGKSDTGVMLMAHYDSRGHIGRGGETGRSYGASDDGYGVGTLMEIVRLFANKADKLENSIYVLFTDAEETSLGGATFAAENDDFTKNISFVMNVEARGTTGPVYLFETNMNNNKIMDLYSHADDQYAYSIATAIYQVMPNYTDLVPFTEKGIPGVNFGCLDSLETYHNSLDNFDNIDPSTIQQYGKQIVPMLNEFTSNAKYNDVNYFKTDLTNVFFMILPGILINYNNIVAIILGFILLVALILLIVKLTTSKAISLKNVLINSGLILGTIVVVAVIGLLLSMLAAKFGGVVWNITNTRTLIQPYFYYISLIVIAIVLYKLVAKFLPTKKNNLELLIAGNAILVLLTVILNFTLVGATFLFFIPSLFSTIALYLYVFVKKEKIVTSGLIVSQCIVILLYFPLLYGLYIAITIGGLVALYPIFIFFLLTVLPTFNLVRNKKLT